MESTIQMAEMFLVKCLKQSTTKQHLYLTAFSSSVSRMAFNRTPCTSTNV